MKVSIVVVVYNLPAEVTILQVNAIRKFCKDEHEIFIIDNSTDRRLEEGTRYHSGQLGVQYMKTHASSKNGSDSHSFAANLSYQRLKNSAPVIAYLDHDVIPVTSFSFVEILGEKLIAGLGQGDKTPYYWPGMVFWRNDIVDKELIDFSPLPGMDTGASFCKIIDKYGKDQCIFFNESYHENPYFKHPKYGFYSMINDQMFMHYVNSSNWNFVSGNDERLNSLINITRELIGD